ncbi:MAG: 23S rRNA (adenine(1618)-N(6))-methyltransferase RlmF [Bdellovibrio sp.]|nr:23S rRNA (adenine(1618)-N(6))-methyltransferase RlmF [Methylotenera sp.]
MALVKQSFAVLKRAKSSPKSAPIETEKYALHPRNKHRQRYDFDALIKTSPALALFVRANEHGDSTIDFANPKAVLALNSALLQHFYNIQHWRIPAGYLCPPIPGRADYLHHVADLLGVENVGVTPHISQINVLDIGVGANLIYPIIGQREYAWRFVGADCDPIALNNAQQIIDSNFGLADCITLRLQTNRANIFKGMIGLNDFFDLTICNPPFHASLADAEVGTRRKWQQLSHSKTPNKSAQLKSQPNSTRNFGGQGAELYCAGGEKAFISNMIIESAQFSAQCVWFTTMVSAANNLPNFYKTLKKAGALHVKTIDMAQGNKKSRILAWTFLNEKQQQTWRDAQKASLT